MKTTELIKKANREIKNIKTELRSEEICFYEEDQEKPFYKYPTWGKTRGSGTANFIYLNGDTIDSIYMLHIFKLLDLLDEYIETDLEDREEEKKYYVKLPKVTRDRKAIYLLKQSSSCVNPITVDWSDENYIKSGDETYRFTEKEIKEIDERYWPFAEEVK